MSNTNHSALPSKLGLDNLPPLDVWTDEALLADYTAEIAMDTERGVLDMSPVPAAMNTEILRRMKR